MKKFTFKNVLDGFRSSVTQPTAGKPEQVAIVETLRPDFFQVSKTVRHGFPFQPSCVAFDPIQKLLAVGTKQGSIRLIGSPGVDIHLHHGGDSAVLQIVFLANEGALVDFTTDDVIYLWNFRQKKPEIVHSLKFQRERITCICLPFRSKWLYVGTERGNVHIVNIEVFQLSGYIINWNKAIELSRKTHPGAVVHLSDCPIDPSKLLIGYDSGQMVIWDLRTRVAEVRYLNQEPLRSICWHHEGKQFMCSHTDGSITTWNVKPSTPCKPASTIFPHAKMNKNGKQETCKPIQKVEWTCSKLEDPFVIFSGGLTNDLAGRTPSITVIHGKTTTVLEMEHPVIDFITLRETVWDYDFGEPYALVVLLHNDLVVVDLHSPGYPCFENPYSMDLHESHVTCCFYIADCPADLIPALYPIGMRSKKSNTGPAFSDKEWPISGGEWGTSSCSYSEMIITGHADGSLKFWDASSLSFLVLYKLKTAKVFEKPKTKSVDGDDDPFAVQHIALCPESRLLCIAGASSHIIFFKFSKQETSGEVPCLEIPIVYDMDSGNASPDSEFPPQNSVEYFVSIHVRGGIQKKAPGYQAELVCLTPWVNGEPPGSITALTINSSYGLIAYGNESGLVMVDYVQKTCLLNMGTPELYGAADPYQRAPRSPKKGDKDDERSKSPSSDQDKSVEIKEEFEIIEVENLFKKIGEKPADDKIVHPTAKVMDNQENKVDFMKFIRDTENLQGQDSISSNPDKNEDVADNQNDDINYVDTIKDVDDLPESLFFDEAAEEATESTGGESPKDYNPPTEIEPQSLPNAKPHAPRLAHISYSLSEQHGKKYSKFRLKDHLSKLDAKVRRAFSWEQSGHIEMGHSVDFELDNGDVKPQSGQEENHYISPEGELTVEKQIPTITCNSSSSISSSPAVSPRITPRVTPKPSPLEDKHFVETESENISTKHSKSSLELFDKDGNPVPPMRRKVKIGSCSDMKLGANEAPIANRRKLSQGSLTGSVQGDLTPGDRTTPSAEVASPSYKGPIKSFFSNITRKGSSQALVDKLDGPPFSRSRSSSISSLDNITSEAIQCLAFADSYSRKNDSQLCPTLWAGTRLGSVIQVMILIPSTAETRLTTPVTVSPTGTIFRLKGSILAMSFLDCNGSLIHYAYESWRDLNKENKRQLERTPTKALVNNRMSPTGSGGEQNWDDRQFVVIASDKVARVVALPSHNCIYKQIITDVSFVVKAEVTQMKDAVCLVCYIGTGHISIFSLPSLRQLIYVDFLPLVDLRIAKTFCFTNHGHGLYLCSPSEIQKFTISSEFIKDMQELLGLLFLPCDTPEPPKQSFGFFKGIFGGGVSQLDREELFGESSGKACRSVAKHLTGTNAQLENMSLRAGTVAAEVAKTKMALIERGEKLEKLSDQTQKMMDGSEAFSHTAHNLMQKYKDKKWYQI